MHAATSRTLFAAAFVLAGACSGSDAFGSPVVDRPPAPQAEAVYLTHKEAGHLAAGQLIDIYRLDAYPIEAASRNVLGLAVSPGQTDDRRCRRRSPFAEPLANDTRPPKTPCLTRANAGSRKSHELRHEQPDRGCASSAR